MGIRIRSFYQLVLAAIRIIRNEGWRSFFRKLILWLRLKRAMARIQPLGLPSFETSMSKGEKQQIIESEAIRGFITGLCKKEGTWLEKFLYGYWIKTGHIDRLIYVFQHIAPLLKENDRLLDLGSFGDFPLLLWRFLKMKSLYACSLEGDHIAYGQGRLISPRDQSREFELVIDKINLECDPLPFPNESLDVITCFEVIEHLRNDPMFMMGQCNRVLKNGGLFILTTPNVNSYHGILRMIKYESPMIFSRYFPDIKERLVEPSRKGIGHAKEYSVNEIIGLLINSGFQILHLQTYDFLGLIELSNDFIEKFANLKDFLKKKGWQEELAGHNILAIGKKERQARVRYYFPLYEVDAPVYLK
jgi:SAM-dependent methyltransferase